jgi:hypothetical protein
MPLSRDVEKVQSPPLGDIDTSRLSSRIKPAVDNAPLITGGSHHAKLSFAGGSHGSGHVELQQSGQSGFEPPSGSPIRVIPATSFSSKADLATIGDVEGSWSQALQAFVPNIAVHTTADVQELFAEKGFQGGLWQLLRPFGEQIQGKVTIRDISGTSRTWEDFAVRFVPVVEVSESFYDSNLASTSNVSELRSDHVFSSSLGANAPVGNKLDDIEKLLEWHLSQHQKINTCSSSGTLGDKTSDTCGTQNLYPLYQRRLLSAIPFSPHETFSHPVACIVAVSSHNSNPIKSLGKLYEDSSRGKERPPQWMYKDYLRYYVLVHDEEKDDINKSTALFEEMKKNFGLHCHFLRVRSSQCIITDDDAILFPACTWMSASEELSKLRDLHGDEEIPSSLCIYESDAIAIRSFIREMVTQSIVPYMERCVSLWNEQVISKRTGLSGRFISLSKKWTGLGGGSRTAAQVTANSGTGNYDSVIGCYRTEAPEALMRKLGDFALMLRDWKLAQVAYDFCRTDFHSDKAWQYHAAASEMTAISSLLGSQFLGIKTRLDVIDQTLDASIYSYLTRCSNKYGSVRSLVFGFELLALRGPSALDSATRWGSRLLESQCVGDIGASLLKERLSTIYASRIIRGNYNHGTRIRKAAFWKIMAAQDWLVLGKKSQAGRCIKDAEGLYQLLPNKNNILLFGRARSHLAEMSQTLQATSSMTTRLSDEIEVDSTPHAGDEFVNEHFNT